MSSTPIPVDPRLCRVSLGFHPYPRYTSLARAPCSRGVASGALVAERGHASKALPAGLANQVVRLEACNAAAPAGRTDVYLMGMSHVSKAAVHAVEALIAAVKPEVVLVEVCKDRIGLLMNPDGPKDQQLWTSRKFSIEGLPGADGWPSESALLSVTATKPGDAFTTSDLETDCVRLLETGLFKSVRPRLVRPGALDCPQFVRVSGSRIASVPPLGPVEYVVTPRVLPKPTCFSVRIDSSLNRKDLKIDPAITARIEEQLLSECKSSKLASKDNQAEPLTQLQPHTQEAPDQSTKESEERDFQQQRLPSQQTACPTLDALLRAKRKLHSLVSASAPDQQFTISLNGIDSGEVEAVVRADDGVQAYRSCLEGSAQGGAGYGIDTFKPQRGPLQISSNLKIPNIARVLRKDRDKSGDYITTVPRGERGSTWRRWTAQEMDEAQLADEEQPEGNFGRAAANLLSQTYAQCQNAAAEKTGIKPGAAWRAALEAASRHDGSQACPSSIQHTAPPRYFEEEVLLGDMPADRAADSLAKGVWSGVSARILFAATAAAAAVAAAATHVLPSVAQPYFAASTAAVIGVAAFPVLAPLTEIFLFSKMSADRIEEAVRIKVSLKERGTEMLRLPGEDAIIGWPNAKRTIIDARDQYMARTLHAAATGVGASPAFVLDTSQERHVWRYAMPRDAPAGCSTAGCGDGEYVPAKNIKAVVGIVGSAHVGGIVREWPKADDVGKLTHLLGESPA